MLHTHGCDQCSVFLFLVSQSVKTIGFQKYMGLLLQMFKKYTANVFVIQSSEHIMRVCWFIEHFYKVIVREPKSSGPKVSFIE